MRRPARSRIRSRSRRPQSKWAWLQERLGQLLEQQSPPRFSEREHRPFDGLQMPEGFSHQAPARKEGPSRGEKMIPPPWEDEMRPPGDGAGEWAGLPQGIPPRDEGMMPRDPRRGYESEFGVGERSERESSHWAPGMPPDRRRSRGMGRGERESSHWVPRQNIQREKERGRREGSLPSGPPMGMHPDWEFMQPPPYTPFQEEPSAAADPRPAMPRYEREREWEEIPPSFDETERIHDRSGSYTQPRKRQRGRKGSRR